MCCQDTPSGQPLLAGSPGRSPQRHGSSLLRRLSLGSANTSFSSGEGARSGSRLLRVRLCRCCLPFGPVFLSALHHARGITSGHLACCYCAQLLPGAGVNLRAVHSSAVDGPAPRLWSVPCSRLAEQPHAAPHPLCRRGAARQRDWAGAGGRGEGGPAGRRAAGQGGGCACEFSCCSVKRACETV